MKTLERRDVIECMSFPMVFLGGPGTKKTTYARAHIDWLLSQGCSVLAVSHTNAAADQLAVSGAEHRTIDSLYWHGLRELGLEELLYDDNYRRREKVFSRNRKEFQNSYDVVVLDEGQDASYEQLRNLWEVCDGRLHIFADIDQCIYEWRDAAPRRLYEFCHYQRIEPVALDFTFRLTRPVLEASQRLISHNSFRFDVPLRTDKDGPPIEIDVTYNDIQATMSRLKEVNSNDVAVLIRNLRNRKFMKTFWDQGLGKVADYHKPYAGTIHGAKGLEWEHVFIVRANVSEFAHSPLEEERRVFYTGMTRTSGLLHISAWKPICFIREALDGDYLEKNG